jgi:hypothetical protein
MIVSLLRTSRQVPIAGRLRTTPITLDRIQEVEEMQEQPSIQAADPLHYRSGHKMTRG